MKTFKEFTLCLERYYRPAEKLPSGRSPMEKARGSLVRSLQDPNARERNDLQVQRYKTKVKRGSRNPSFDRTPSSNEHIKITPGKNRTHITDTKNNIHFTVLHRGKEHTVSFIHTNPAMYDPQTPNRDKFKFMRNIENLYKSEVEHRFPHGHVASNFPISNKRANSNQAGTARDELYRRKAGFGRKERGGYQYGQVGNPPTPRQIERGTKTTRLSPIDYGQAMDIKYN